MRHAQTTRKANGKMHTGRTCNTTGTVHMCSAEQLEQTVLKTRIQNLAMTSWTALTVPGSRTQTFGGGERKLMCSGCGDVHIPTAAEFVHFPGARVSSLQEPVLSQIDVG